MFNITPEELRNKRLDICNNCDNFLKITQQCKKCGCFMPLKALGADFKCPIGKWEVNK